MKVLTKAECRRLLEIKDEIKELLDEARRLVRGTREEARAKAYWYGHMVTALDEDHEFLGSSMCTMQDSISSLEHQASGSNRDPEGNDDDDEVEDRV